MKKLILTLSLVVFLFGFWGCEKEPEGDGLVLTGTSWRLQGYFDIEANEFTKAMLTEDITVDDCVECYTLKFETDGKVIAQVIDNRFLFKHFLTDSAILSEFIWHTGPTYGGNEILYYYAFMSFLNLDESELVAAENISIPPIPYSIENNTLKIYYTDLYDNNRKKYLLYRRI